RCAARRVARTPVRAAGPRSRRLLHRASRSSAHPAAGDGRSCLPAHRRWRSAPCSGASRARARRPRTPRCGSACCRRRPRAACGRLSGRGSKRRGRQFAYTLHVGEAKLYVIPGSHPSRAAGLMLERKGIPYKRVDMIPGPLKQGWLRLKGFPGDTVPALMLDDEKVQGSREISRALDRHQPEPALFPSDPEKLVAVEDAERWGDEVLQSMPRRISWNSLGRDHSAMSSYAEGAKLGVPTPIAARTGGPVIAMAKRRNNADDENVRRDLAELPGVLDHVDELISKGVIGGDEP